MKYLLDSDIVSEFYETTSTGHVEIAARLSGMDEDSDVVHISILTLYEFEYGYANAPEEMKEVIRGRIESAQEDFVVLPLSAEGARLYGEIKRGLVSVRQLSQKAGKLHNIDVMVAATAVAEGCILVSADSIYRDLQKIKAALLWENWLAGDKT